MILNADDLLPHLSASLRRGTRDRSRHLLCPSCRVRTKLYQLTDGRRKCGACGKKFDVGVRNQDVKLQQYAQLLLCFCLDFTAHRAAQITGHRYRLVAGAYMRFRRLLVDQSLVPGKIHLMTCVENAPCSIHESAFCRKCRGKLTCRGRQGGDAPVFGVRLLQSKQVFLEPLREEEEASFPEYQGFVCRGKLHHFADREQEADGLEQFWSWIKERLRKHHGVDQANLGFYLKELEWKYNHRLLSPEVQAVQIAQLLPSNFLRSWSVR